MALVYEEFTKILRRCFFDVQNEVGLGRRENGYHDACVIWLQENNVPIQNKQAHHLMLDGQIAHSLYPDLVAWDAITVELKAVARKLATSEFVQLFDYLKCRADRLGLLVNMGLDRVYVERVVYEPPQCQLKEDWRYWNGRISGNAREVGAGVRDALRSVYQAHTTGYGDEVTRKLVQFALKQRQLKNVVAPISETRFRGKLLDKSPLDCLVVEDCVVLVLTALFDGNQFNISRGLSFMQALNIGWGVAANFGRQVAEFTGLHSNI
jgi:GxxExxY protein